ncbi:thioredoxin-like protein [Chitinophaga skermanii]|uniref:Thioredoxin-like protein n=1 Tax=Chitinophaga skermanii TaxID=331697 RepID=A0A327QWD8_9BACT|nr:vitamin K epoxide reductase family protein [Chitinophaga skermanii]RAJ08208.1 thioredoxin-like protein [Chitinophaga skermanii]
MKSRQTIPVFEDTAYNWMRKMGIPVNKSFIAQELQTHPHYPSLISLVDFLDMGGMQYYALESERQYIPKFTYPLLAHVREEDSQRDYLVQVNNVADWDQNEMLKNSWTGVVLFPGEQANWEFEGNNRLVQQDSFLRTLLAAGVVGLLGLLTLLFWSQLNIWLISWSILIVAGFMFSAATLATELGVKIKVVKEVCNAVSHSGCDAILRSKYAKGIWGISLADFSFAFFSTQLLFLLFSVRFPALINAIQVLALPMVLVAVASVYMQKYKVKSWCALCLGIVGVLTLQFAVSLIYLPTFINSIDPIALGIFFGVQAVVCAILLPVKSIAKYLREQAESAIELLKWKKDAGVFTHLWQQSAEADTRTWNNEFQFGNPEAKIQITVACNPYCGPCAGAHETLDQLYHQYKNDINIKVRFSSSTTDPNERRALALTHILRKAYTLATSDERAAMIHDWFLHMNLEKFLAKWSTNNEDDVAPLRQQFNRWMEYVGVKGTPTIYINGREFPRKYQLKDLIGLIPNLQEVEEFTSRNNA